MIPSEVHMAFYKPKSFDKVANGQGGEGPVAVRGTSPSRPAALLQLTQRKPWSGFFKNDGAKNEGMQSLCSSPSKQFALPKSQRSSVKYSSPDTVIERRECEEKSVKVV